MLWDYPARQRHYEALENAMHVLKRKKKWNSPIARNMMQALVVALFGDRRRYFNT